MLGLRCHAGFSLGAVGGSALWLCWEDFSLRCLLLLQSVGSSDLGLQQFQPPGSRAQARRRLTVLATLRYVGPSWTRDQTGVPCRDNECFVVFFYFLKRYLFIWLHWVLVAACGIFSWSIRALSCRMWGLVLGLGIQPEPPALGAWSVSRWTTREIPNHLNCFIEIFF